MKKYITPAVKTADVCNTDILAGSFDTPNERMGDMKTTTQGGFARERSGEDWDEL